jgi:hypothetical protein
VSRALAAFVAGFVAAEGCCTSAPTSRGRRFAFRVALASVDAEVCHLLHAFFGVGSVRTYARRRPHHDDECVFAVQGRRDLVEVVVPFLDAHLPPSHKRDQYEAWRAALLRAG